MPTTVERDAPERLADAGLVPRGRVLASPSSWRDHLLYSLLPDRFSDGREGERPRFDRHDPARHAVSDLVTWRRAGTTFQGGTLCGVAGKLDYLAGLGVGAIWLGPVWRQRPDLRAQHRRRAGHRRPGGAPAVRLMDTARGLRPAEDLFGLYRGPGHDLLGSHREVGRYHVSTLDDHDMVGRAKRRFAAGNPIAARNERCTYLSDRRDRAAASRRRRHGSGAAPRPGVPAGDVAPRSALRASRAW